jgi:dynein intermediate chain
LKADKIRYDGLREEERLKEPVELTPQESKKIIDSESFQQFFTKASKMMERALSVSGAYDITVDYGGGNDQDSGKDQKMVLQTTFKDKVTGGRPVTSISWSPKHPELFLASYASQENPMSFDPDGTVRVWNIHVPGRPEFTFYCNSEVLAAQFHPTNPFLIIGACQSGQVVIWDTREKEYPVNRTSLSSGHTHPIHGLASLPVVNKMHNILSISTDGHLCVWSDKDLHSPSTEVKLELENGKDEITANCVDYPNANANTVVLGSDEGAIYKAHIYDKAGIYEQIAAHDAPISNVCFNPSFKNSNLADLYLTSSYDWTVKLWSLKSSSPLYTFESARDYVYDAQWSPVHPSLFCMGDGSGNVDMWNVARDSEAPVYSTKLPDTSSTSGETAAVSRIQWNHSGSHVAIGTSTGAICMYTVRSELGTPSAEDASQMYDKMNSKLLSLTG